MAVEIPGGVSVNSEPLVLVCAADNEFAMPLAAMLASVMANLQTVDGVALFIINGGIRDRNRHKIQQSLDLNRITITWLEPPLERLEGLKVQERIPIASYYRLLIPELLPPQYSKAIYLDSDLIVNADLGQLWQLNLENHALLAVQDPIIRTVSNRNGLANYRDLELAPDTPYFNAGVLVLNLSVWRTQHLSRQILQYLVANRDTLRWHDQDGLNAILAQRWGQLNPRWNQLHIIHKYRSWQESPYPESTYRAVLEDPYIVHYTTSSKPWRVGCQHPKRDLFYDYLNLTAWSSWRPTRWNRGLRKLERLQVRFRL
ncbi:MAG: glycosyltransferase family 8 protein [Desertifilum sp.]|nr:glycosyltransferase family 8 protein [Desertifilum sp.]MDI9640518.1 glycosyltransferase family 8 protein [Geitlerinema splendidum]